MCQSKGRSYRWREEVRDIATVQLESSEWACEDEESTQSSGFCQIELETKSWWLLPPSAADVLKRSRFRLAQPAHNILVYWCFLLPSNGKLSLTYAVLRQIRVAEDYLDPTESELLYTAKQIQEEDVWTFYWQAGVPYELNHKYLNTWKVYSSQEQMFTGA